MLNTPKGEDGRSCLQSDMKFSAAGSWQSLSALTSYRDLPRSCLKSKFHPWFLCRDIPHKTVMPWTVLGISDNPCGAVRMRRLPALSPVSRIRNAGRILILRILDYIYICTHTYVYTHMYIYICMCVIYVRMYVYVYFHFVIYLSILSIYISYIYLYE